MSNLDSRVEPNSLASDRPAASAVGSFSSDKADGGWCQIAIEADGGLIGKVLPPCVGSKVCAIVDVNHLQKIPSDPSRHLPPGADTVGVAARGYKCLKRHTGEGVSRPAWTDRVKEWLQRH